MTLECGIHGVPAGHLATVITSLEMTAPEMRGPKPFPIGIVANHEQLDLAAYRDLFRAVGGPWLWTSRLMMDDAALGRVINDPLVETWVIRQNENAIGLIEFDFRTANECELVLFGMITEATGQGLGGPMIALVQSHAFARPVSRLFVHTCTYDAPTALPFYQKAGFTAYRTDVEVYPDPRVLGVLPKTIAPHVPCLP